MKPAAFLAALAIAVVLVTTGQARAYNIFNVIADATYAQIGSLCDTTQSCSGDQSWGEFDLSIADQNNAAADSFFSDGLDNWDCYHVDQGRNFLNNSWYFIQLPDLLSIDPTVFWGDGFMPQSFWDQANYTYSLIDQTQAYADYYFSGCT